MRAIPTPGAMEIMREYELTVVYDLALAEVDGPDASVSQVTQVIEARGGKMLKVDHWGRRRMAYPIKNALDADYVVTRVELEPGEVGALETALGINERVYRHLIVRADELPAPPPPREPRREPAVAAPSEAVVEAGAEAPEGAPMAGAEVPAAEEAPGAAEEAPTAEEAPLAAAEVPAAEEPPVAAGEAPTAEEAPGAAAEIPAAEEAPEAPAVAEAPEGEAEEPAGEGTAAEENTPKE